MYSHLTNQKNSNAFIFPVIYFFYPETTRRSLEEMDRIFRKTTSIFTLVRTAKEEPHMYGRHGELLHTVDDVEDDAVHAVRKHDIADHPHKEHSEHVENNEKSGGVEESRGI